MIKRKMGQPHTIITTQGSLLVIGMARFREYWPLKSSIAKLRRSTGGLLGSDGLLFCTA